MKSNSELARVRAAYLAASGMAALTLSLAATPAYAQQAPATDDDQTTSVVDEDEPTASQGGEIIVTGSRIRRRDEFASPDPVTIIDPGLAKAAGQFSTAEMLQSSVVASGSPQITSAISSAFVTNGGVGTETISLRGLGDNRTLVLLNGRRAGPAGTRGAITAFDLNVLPQSIVRSIEILKTGASSIYGSDAVAGVVNIFTKRDTDGFEFDGFASVPEESGGEQYRASLTWGEDFGRGHILATVDYNYRSALQRKHRDYLGCPEEYIFNRAGDRVDIIDPRTGQPRCNDTLWGHVWTYDSAYRQSGLYQPDYGDNLGRFIARNPTAGFTVPSNFFRVTRGAARYAFPNDTATNGQPDTRAALSVQNVFHPFMLNETLQPKTERFTAYIDGSFEVSDNLEIGGELLYNNRKNEVFGYRQFYYLTGFTNNFAPGIGDPFSPGWSGRYFLSPTAITDHNGTRIEVDYYRGAGWLEGNLSGLLDGWNYSAYTQYSKSKGRYETDIIFKDAVDLHDFRTSSCAGQTLPKSGVKCIDVNWTTPDFLAGNLTAAERAFLFGVDVGNTTYQQWVNEASVSGPLFSLPAGEIQVALGGAYRTDKINDVPGEQTRIGNSWGLTSAGITAGRTETLEAFGEIELPLIHNTPLIDSFTVNGSGRVTNVKAVRASDGKSDTTKGNWTYSVGANWAVTDFLRFRARYGTSFRAPALYEQFLSNQTSFLTQRQVDPCIQVDSTPNINARIAANCKKGTSTLPPVPGDHSGAGVGATIITGGGLGVLDPETSTAKTASVILTPRLSFLPNTKLDIAVDYFDIVIKGQIATLGAASIISGCYNSEFFPDEPLCNLFTRVPAGASGQFNIKDVTATFINVNRQRNEGIDVTVNLEQGLGSLGSLQLLAQMNWQLRDEIALFSGTLVDNNGESGDPKWIGDFNLVYKPTDTFSIFYGLDVIGPVSDTADYVAINGDTCRTFQGYGEICVDVDAEAVFYHSLSVTKEIENFTITAGISNVFDREPPRVTVSGSNSLNSGVSNTVGRSLFASQYDYVGRRGFVSVNAKF
jgi:iron complex outermembrane recepter protein